MRQRRALSVEIMEQRTLMTGTITPLLHTPVGPDGGVGTMLLATNGDVFAMDNSGNGGVGYKYYELKPDASGNYVDGNWTQLAASNLNRLYAGSVILPDGRLLVIGGEYSGANGDETDTNEGEIYSPTTNTWSEIAPFPKGNFGDDELVNLGNGKVLAGYLGGPETYIYNANTNTWTQTGTKLGDDQSDEEGFVQLPNGNFLCYNIFSSINDGVGEAQIYSPTTGQWTATSNLPNNELLSDAASGYELGGGLLLPDGRVFWIGGNGNTAYYNYQTNVWTAGPSIPSTLVQDDAPTAELPNGKLLLTADTVGYNGPTHAFEYDPLAQTYTDITTAFPQGYLDGPAFIDRMLVLPDGQVLVNNGGNQPVLYTPDSGALATNVPTISSIQQNNDGSFLLTGTKINGNSDGAVYGDDAQMASNYPIVTFTNSTGQVSYATTSNFNYQVEQGAKSLTTNFTVPVGLPSGKYAVRVIANGASSAPDLLTFPLKTGDVPSIVVPAAAASNPVITKTTQLSVLGGDTDGEGTLSYQWAVTAEPAMAVTPTFSTNNSNAAKNVAATFYGVGNYSFTVTATNQAGLSVNSTVNVNVVPYLTSLALAPTLVQLVPNQTEQFNVSAGLDQFGDTVTTSSLTWSLLSGGGTLTQSGLYTAPASGTIATIKVAAGAVSQGASIYVLSTPWTQTDVGTPPLQGDAANNAAGVFTLLGSGSGISANSDQFQYTFLSLTGNSTVQAQVGTIGNTGKSAVAGVSYRSNNSGGSPNVTLVITPNNGLTFSYRVLAGGNTISLTVPRVTPGDYVKLVRVGNLFTGYYSVNGTTWTSVGSPANVAVGATAEGGLVASSGVATALSTSTFSHVLADATPTIAIAASANPSPVTGTTTTLSVLGADSAGESALTYTWTVTALPAGAVAPIFATNGTNASKSDLLTFSKSGTYGFQVVAANALGYSVTSSTSVTVVQTATTVSITPTTATVLETQSLQLTAQVLDQFHQKMAVQPRFTFSIVAGGAGGKISSSGLYTAPNRTGLDIINVTSTNSASTARITVIQGISNQGLAVSKSATVSGVSVGWGTESAPLSTTADGLRLLPAGRRVDLPWAGINSVTVSLSQGEPLVASDVSVTGLTVANYGPVTVTAVPGVSGRYVIGLSRAISSADRVALTISSSNVTTYRRELDVLPGDVNDDGVVDASDTALATSYLLSTYTPGDVLGRGKVTVESVKEIALLNGTKLPV